MNKPANEITGSRTQRHTFLKLFSETARYHHRFEVFRDFVTLSAIALHNAVSSDDVRESEYHRIIGRYSGEDPQRMARLLTIVVDGLEAGPEDFLGPLFMDLELGDSYRGQFYTPTSVATFMAEMQFADMEKLLEARPFVTVSEPACGAGGMILPLVGCLLRNGHDPALRLWVQAVDVDRTAALMCYIQLALWNVPAEVIVGNSITLDCREVWRTPAYHLFGWKARLRRAGIQEGFP